MMILKNGIKFLTLATVSLLTLSGITDTDTTYAQEGNEGNLVIGMNSEMVSLDPHGSNDNSSAQIRRNIYEPLINFDTEMNLEPSLATEWEQVDELTWNFTLREGVTFHEGSDFTAEDVKATFDRVRDPALGSEVLFLFEMIDEVEIVSDYEVNFITGFPFAPLQNHLAHGSSGIMSKELIDADYQNAIDEAGLDITLDEYYELREAGGDEFQDVADEIGAFLGEVVNTELDGTGPLVFVNRQAGSHVDLTRYDDYWGDLGNYVDVTYTVNTEAGSRMAELETGNIHVAINLEPSSIARVEQTEGLDLVQTESLRMSYLSFNTEKEPFDDPLVRQAISYAIDRESIIAGIYDNIGTPAISPLAPSVWGHNPDIESIAYDMDEAQALLDQTDVADGFETTLWVYDVQQDIDKAVLIQESLANLGITVNIEQLELGAFLERTGNGEHDMFILGWTTVTADADYGMYALFHSNSKGAPGNRSFYENPEVDALLDAGRSEIDIDARYDIYTEVQEILAEDAPMAYLIHTNAVLGVNSNYVDGILVDPVNYVRFHDVEFVE